MTAKTGRTSPTYPSLCYAVMKGLYLGTSSYVKPIAFIVQRCPDPFGQGASVAQINNASDGADSNPVLAVYDAMTNPAYGLGIPAAKFDVNVWKAAAQTCATEGLGISMQFDSQSTADNLIGEILRHCDGVIYTDPSTGLWEIVLARGGYDPTTLPVLTVDNVIDTPDYSRGSWSETSNQIQIRYLDRASNFSTRTAQAQDTANIAVTGEVRNQAIDFNGLARASTAALVATRVLKTMSYPLSKLTVTTNRTAWSWRPGGLFKFTWLPLGINNQVFRITRISYGEILNGKITIDAVEDIFGISSVAYDPPPSSGWISPIGAPQAAAAQMLVEVPYHIVYWAESLTMGIYAMAFCARGDSTSKSFEIWLNEGSGDFLSHQIYAFTPVGQLKDTYSAGTLANDATGFVLDLPGQIDLLNLASVSSADQGQGVNLLMIDLEIMSWKTVTANSDGTYTIAGIMRGVMDTVPQTHAAGAHAWFFSEGVGETKTNPYASDLTVSAKLLPINDVGEYPLTSASSTSVTTASRYAKPYPPGCLQEQGQSYGTRFSSVVGDFTVSWKSRNRLTQAAAGTMTLQDAADIAGEAGQTFTVRIFLNSSLIRTVTGITTPENYTYTAAQRVADDPDGSKTVTIKISSVIGGLESFLPNSTEAFTMTGFGMDFGNFFGGKHA